MTLQGERVSLRPLARPDLDEVEAWAPFTDPLYQGWNRFPWHRLGKDLWHALESTDPAVQRFAVLDLQGRVIGLAALVDVDGRLAPILSIFLGSDYCGQGLGTDALRTLLRYAFQERRFAAVRLSVAATNARACRAYARCGFRVTGRHFHPTGEGESLAFLDEPRYQGLRSYFREEAGRTYVLFYEMEVRAAEWRARG